MNIEGVLKTVSEIKSNELEDKVNSKLSEFAYDINKFVDDLVKEFNLSYNELSEEDQTMIIKNGLEKQLVLLFGCPLTFVPNFKLDEMSKEELLIGHLIKNKYTL